MHNFFSHIININVSARDALRVISELPDKASLTLFVVDDLGLLRGTITDGDIRRGLLNDLEISQSIDFFMFREFKYLYDQFDNVSKIKEYRSLGVKLVPLINREGKLIDIIDLTKTKTLLPLTALLMAGGRGERLKPMTDRIPKPMLKVGDKPILEHNIDRLINFGIKEFFISVKYLKHKIMDYFGDGSSKGVSIQYLEEDKPLGTLGSLSLLDKISYDDLLVMNSDILTNINFEDFFDYYKQSDSELMVASIPYTVAIPYAVLKTDNNVVHDFEEKPNYTYYSNAGIYLMKFRLKKHLIYNEFYNATDLMNLIIRDNKKRLTHYPILDYWLDIGKQQDYLKAQDDIKHIIL